MEKWRKNRNVSTLSYFFLYRLDIRKWTGPHGQWHTVIPSTWKLYSHKFLQNNWSMSSCWGTSEGMDKKFPLWKHSHNQNISVFSYSSTEFRIDDLFFYIIFLQTKIPDTIYLNTTRFPNIRPIRISRSSLPSRRWR